jgi:hypothetical protein
MVDWKGIAQANTTTKHMPCWGKVYAVCLPWNSLESHLVAHSLHVYTIICTGRVVDGAKQEEYLSLLMLVTLSQWLKGHTTQNSPPLSNSKFWGHSATSYHSTKAEGSENYSLQSGALIERKRLIVPSALLGACHQEIDRPLHMTFCPSHCLILLLYISHTTLQVLSTAQHSRIV